jgi:hypothetical protein
LVSNKIVPLHSKIKVMIKTIQSISQTKHYHPAVGQLYKITFTDNTQDLVYAETFFHQIKDWMDEQGFDWLVGQTLNTDEDYFNFEA